MNTYSRIFHDSHDYQTCPLGEQSLADTLRPSRGQAKYIFIFALYFIVDITVLFIRVEIRLLLLLNILLINSFS